MLRGGLEWWHVVIIAVVLFALFGYKRLPSATKSIAQSLKIFRDETRGLRGEDEPSPVPPGEHVGGTSTSGAIPAPVTIPAPPPAAQPQQVAQEPAAVPAPSPQSIAASAQSLAPKPTAR